MTNPAPALQDQLSVHDAKELIEFISNTNYRIAPHGDGAFDTKDEALLHVESEDYDPELPLQVCFDTAQGNYWDSIEITCSDSVWHGDDGQMGGHSASGNSIEEMLVAFKHKSDPTCKYSPVALLINKVS